jgi:spore germination protein KC
MRKIWIKLVNYMLLILLLTGCWDQKEIEKRAYVYGIGMDKGEKEGNIRITYLIVNPEFGTPVTGGSSDEPPTEIISFETNDLISARNVANAVISKDITYDLLRVFFISEDLARDKNFIRWMYDATKDREIRRDNYFVVTKESVDKFLEQNNPKMDTRVHKYFDQIFEQGSENGLIPNSLLHWYFKITEADADLYLSIYGTTEHDKDDQSGKDEDAILAGQLNTKGNTNKTQFIGSAVFKEGKMIGTLNGEETRLAVLLNDTLHMSDVLTTFPDPQNEKYRVAARLVKKRPNKVKMSFQNGNGKIDVTIPLNVEIMSDHSMVSYAKAKSKREQLKISIKERMEKNIEELVRKTQEEFKGEPFSWSLLARKKFLTIKEYEQFDWMKSYPNMEISVNVDIRLGEFGRQGELPTYEDVRD